MKALTRVFIVEMKRTNNLSKLPQMNSSWKYGLIHGGLAQLGERLLCKQEVNGSIPLISTTGIIRFVLYGDNSKYRMRQRTPNKIVAKGVNLNAGNMGL